jgi:hypothetical protein
VPDHALVEAGGVGDIDLVRERHVAALGEEGVDAEVAQSGKAPVHALRHAQRFVVGGTVDGYAIDLRLGSRLIIDDDQYLLRHSLMHVFLWYLLAHDHASMERLLYKTAASCSRRSSHKVEQSKRALLSR